MLWGFEPESRPTFWHSRQTWWHHRAKLQKAKTTVQTNTDSHGVDEKRAIDSPRNTEPSYTTRAQEIQGWNHRRNERTKSAGVRRSKGDNKSVVGGNPTSSWRNKTNWCKPNTRSIPTKSVTPWGPKSSRPSEKTRSKSWIRSNIQWVATKKPYTYREGVTVT